MSENKFTVPAKTSSDGKAKKTAAETGPAKTAQSPDKPKTVRKTAAKPKTGTGTKKTAAAQAKAKAPISSAKEFEQPELFEIEKPEQKKPKTGSGTAKPKTPKASTAKPKAAKPEEKPKNVKEAISAKAPDKPAQRFRVELDKPSLEASRIPDMSLLSASERHRLVMEQSGEKKKSQSEPEKKTEKKSTEERSVRLETIKASQKERAGVKIPELGHRSAKKKNSLSVAIWILLSIVVVLSLSLVLYAVKSRKSVSPVIAENTIVSPVAEESADDSVVIKIEAGMSAGKVASLLSGYIDEKALLDAILSNGLEGSLRVGTYRIGRGADPETVARVLSGNVSRITIPDGMTIRDIDTLLKNRGLAEGGEFSAAAEEIAKSEQLPFTEGWFLTGAYALERTNTAKKLASDMHNALLDYIRSNAEAFNESEYSVSSILIIASMMNRETQDEEQMRAIASVIYNRIEADMPLGIDATTRYEIDDWVNPLTREVLDEQTPYNTRRKKGLPPSGIGCVSTKSLAAALHPDKTDYLYYFHAEDGSIHLSYTYDEHLASRAVVK